MSRENISLPGNILEMSNFRYNHCLRYTTIQIGMRHVWCMWSGPFRGEFFGFTKSREWIFFLKMAENGHHLP